jgi:hypothetical protein
MKRLYGTPYQIYPFDKLKEYTKQVHVYVYAGPYKEELLKQLETYANVNIIVL